MSSAHVHLPALSFDGGIEHQIVMFKKLDPAAVIPVRGTPFAAGLDLCVLEDCWVDPGATKRLRTGLAMAIPTGMVGHIHARSSTFYKGLDFDGVIDSDYRGEVLLQARNTGNEPLSFKAGERIAQLLIQKVELLPAVEVPALPTSVRGTQGFGSTGKA